MSTIADFARLTYFEWRTNMNQGVSLGVVVEGMIARMGKTLRDVKDVIPNHPQHPTRVLVMFNDKTSTTLEIIYPRNA